MELFKNQNESEQQYCYEFQNIRAFNHLDRAISKSIWPFALKGVFYALRSKNAEKKVVTFPQTGQFSLLSIHS